KQIDREGTIIYSPAIKIHFTPTVFSLALIFPNPFNPKTIISYQIPVNSYVTLKIFNVIGDEVATLVNEQKDAGTYSVQFDARQLSSGIYFYKLITENFTTAKKMILMK
ncbi:MAG: T9SS type A sorting domain-containing protein, partial [Bacteroidota bacterium]|nr:T9SS type A sorting domain-containing protein [Bacteroidota bacterium]